METSLTIPGVRLSNKVLNNWGVYILFIIWPFAILIYAIINYRKHWARNIFWLYTIYFGFTFVISSPDIDASDYADDLKIMAGVRVGTDYLIESYLAPDSGILDIAQKLITFLVSRFTDDYRFLFAAFGLFMGYFLSRIIWYLIDRNNDKIDIYTGLLLICYSLIVGIWDINGVRWNVAAVIFVYGALTYLIGGKKNGLWIAAITVFVHWSFIIALAVLLGYAMIKNRTIIYFILFVVSFTIAELDIELFRDLFYNYAPSLILESRSGYLNEAYIQVRGESVSNLNWYIMGSYIALKWYIFASVVFMFFFNLKNIQAYSCLLYTSDAADE